MRRLGVTFDIDGVLLRGGSPLPGAAAALARLDAARVPWLLLTNGGGELEEVKARKVSHILGRRIDPAQVVLSHTPLRSAVAAHGAQRALVLGCRDALGVARAYGARRAVDVAALASDDPSRYPFVDWPFAPLANAHEPFGAVFILHDPNSWGAEIQIALDVILGGTPLGSGRTQSVPVYASNADFTFAGAYPVPRLAAGAFLRCLRLMFKDYTNGQELRITMCGKPSTMTSAYARKALAAWRGEPHDEHFDRIVHVGDNPAADIRLALNAGDPWRGALVRTGIFRGDNCADHPAHICADDVGGAVDAILEELK
jgi:HAD superfamily hydrolase (TIGR01456 family)